MKTREPAVWFAVDQRGRITPLGFTQFPRKRLLERVGGTKANKMYVDTSDGVSLHIGYVVLGEWYTLYRGTRLDQVE